MAFRKKCVALLLSSLPIAGCGTIANLAKPGPSGGKIPFGGVKHDVSSLNQAANGQCDCGQDATPEQYRQVALKVICAADLPLSLLGDALTWPYTATYVYINQPTPYPPIKLGPPLPPQQPATTKAQPQTNQPSQPQGTQPSQPQSTQTSS